MEREGWTGAGTAHEILLATRAQRSRRGGSASADKDGMQQGREAPMGRISRRTFLRAAGGAGIVAPTRGIETLTHATRVRATGPLPAPDQSGIEHIVVGCMENRSFDHFLGWGPGATGQQSGLNYADDTGV